MCSSNRRPIVRAKLLNRTENRTPSHVLSNNVFCLRTAAQYVLTIFSTRSKFHPVLNFHVVTRSYSMSPFLLQVNPFQWLLNWLLHTWKYGSLLSTKYYYSDILTE